MTSEYILLALAEGRAPTYTDDEMAAIPGDELASACYIADGARAMVTNAADSLRCAWDALPLDVQLVYWHMRNVCDELGALHLALQGERERRQGAQGAQRAQRAG